MSDHRPQKERMVEKILAAQVLDRMIKHLDGEVELTTSQANVGMKLLAKILPDLKHVEKTGETTTIIKVNKSTAQSIASGVCAAIRKG